MTIINFLKGYRAGKEKIDKTLETLANNNRYLWGGFTERLKDQDFSNMTITDPADIEFYEYNNGLFVARLVGVDVDGDKYNDAVSRYCIDKVAKNIGAFNIRHGYGFINAELVEDYITKAYGLYLIISLKDLIKYINKMESKDDK